MSVFLPRPCREFVQRVVLSADEDCFEGRRDSLLPRWVVDRLFMELIFVLCFYLLCVKVGVEWELPRATPMQLLAPYGYGGEGEGCAHKQFGLDIH